MTFDLSAHVHLGRPLSVHGIALVPLFPAVVPLSFADLAQAVEQGAATVEELAAPTVPALQLQNRGELPLLVTEGSLLIGGMQDRISKRPAWVPPRGQAEVPVQCVEASRWQRRDTAPRGFRAERADIGLRHARMQRPDDQGETWRLVAERRRRAGLADGGGSVHEARQALAVEQRADDMLLPWGACGVVASWAHPGVSRFPMIEWFACPAAFRASWPALRRGLLEAHLERVRAGGRPRVQAPWVQLSEVAQLLAKVDQPATVERHPAGPEAVALHFRRGCMVGWATRVEDRLVHLGAVRS